MSNIHRFDNKIILYAIDISSKSNMRCKHAAVIVNKKGSIVSSECNKAIPFNKPKDFYEKELRLSCHAEVNVLRKTDPRELCGATLYVIRYSGEVMNSKPCMRCMSVIKSCMKKHGLKCVKYTSDNDSDTSD
jgi:tRNA(Arg) A34 adenosine deaminase TadA